MLTSKTLKKMLIIVNIKEVFPSVDNFVNTKEIEGCFQ